MANAITFQVFSIPKGMFFGSKLLGCPVQSAFGSASHWYTGCCTTCGHYCRRWFPRSLWSKKFV